MSNDKRIDYLTTELIRELRELDTFKRPELVKVYINRVIDLVIQKKQEKVRAAI